jgi:hypothetical protein
MKGRINRNEKSISLRKCPKSNWTLFTRYSGREFAFYLRSVPVDPISEIMSEDIQFRPYIIRMSYGTIFFVPESVLLFFELILKFITLY